LRNMMFKRHAWRRGLKSRPAWNYKDAKVWLGHCMATGSRKGAPRVS